MKRWWPTPTQAPSLGAAADAPRPDPVELPGAMRWVERRVRLVHHVLSIVIALLPEQLARGIAEVGAGAGPPQHPIPHSGRFALSSPSSSPYCPRRWGSTPTASGRRIAPALTNTSMGSDLPPATCVACPSPGAKRPDTTRSTLLNHSDDELRQATALFRYGVVADPGASARGHPGPHRPDARQGRPDLGQFPAPPAPELPPTPSATGVSSTAMAASRRCTPTRAPTAASPGAMPPELATRLIALMLDNPTSSVRTVIRAARDAGIDYPLAPSTVHRLFHREGPVRFQAPRRRRFAFRDASELWMSDVMHGPKLRHGRTRRKSSLIAFIDDATRVVPLRRLRHRGERPGLPPRAQDALIRRGIPQRLYVDNGANYRLPTARLGLRKAQHRAHPRPPLSARGKGKDRALVPNTSRRLARPPRCVAHRQPPDAEPQPLGMERGRVPQHPPPSRPRGPHAPRAMGARRCHRALPRRHHRPPPLPLRGQAPRTQGPHRQPARTTLRGRPRSRRRERHLALRPRGASQPGALRRARRKARRPCHPASTPTPIPRSSAASTPTQTEPDDPPPSSRRARRSACEISRRTTDVPATLRLHPLALARPPPTPTS